jgi:hypothetical protein
VNASDTAARLAPKLWVNAFEEDSEGEYDNRAGAEE